MKKKVGKKKSIGKKIIKKKGFGQHKTGGTKMVVCRTIGGFPDRYYAKLRCCVTAPIATFSFAASGTASLSFKLNSLVNPLGSAGTVTGFQNFLGPPTGVGDRQAIYTQYCIRAMSIKVRVSTEATSTNNVLPKLAICPLPRTISTSSTTTAFDLAEMPRAVSKDLNPNISQGGFATQYPLKTYYNMHDIYGLTKGSDIRLNDLWFGTYSTGPSDTRYGTIAISTDSLNTTDATLAFRVDAELTYWCEFFDRNLQFIS